VTKRVGSGGWVGIAQHEAEIQVSGLELRVEFDGAAIFGGGFGVAVQFRKGVGQLEMRDGVRGTSGDDFLQQGNGGVVIVAVEGFLSLLQGWGEGILLRRGRSGSRAGGLRSRRRGGGTSGLRERKRRRG